MKKAPHNLPAAGALGEQLTLIDPPPFCPTWPKRNTFSDRALKRFLDGCVFDHLDFLEGAGSWRLAAVVFELRAQGWPIETIEVPSPSEKHPGRIIALYELPAKYAAEALAHVVGGAR
jgi:hypothetical protein